ncbi:MAG TPA: VOC family protein [Gaiellaceae bacterium]|nr:VOC family protein [Gaiellaceae bacterium]
MAEWQKQIFAINLIVGDLERSKAFYGEVFGLTPLDEWEHGAIFRLGDTFIALRHDASDVVSLAEHGAGQFAIEVEDVEAVRAELEEHGLTLISGPADRDWGMRTLTFADPDGHTWGIAQDLPSAPGS